MIGQSEEIATRTSRDEPQGPHVWPLSFSYGRVMQSAALKLWSQDLAGNVDKVQETVFARAKDNGLAALGKWRRES